MQNKATIVRHKAITRNKRTIPYFVICNCKNSHFLRDIKMHCEIQYQMKIEKENRNYEK